MEYSEQEAKSKQEQCSEKKRRGKKLARKSSGSLEKSEKKSKESTEKNSFNTAAELDDKDNGMKCNRSNCKKDSIKNGNVRRQKNRDLNESQRKAKIKKEQIKLYNKLKNAALSSESSFCDSDYETENKLFNSKADGSDKNAKKFEKDLNDKNIYENSRQASPKSSFANNSPTSIKGTSDHARYRRNNKIKWPEKLLYLEMSRSEFDVTPNEIDTSEKEVKEVNIPVKEVELKEVKANEIRKKPAVDEEKTFEEETLENQIKQVRLTKLNIKQRRNSTDTQSKESEDSLKEKDSCLELHADISNNRIIESSAPNKKDVNTCKDLNLSFNSASYISTPCAKTGVKRTNPKKKNCKRKLEKKKKDCDEIIHGSSLLHNVTGETSFLDMSLPTPNPPRKDSEPLSFSHIASDMDDESSSDEDLPVGLTPLKIEKSFSENDIVWIKWKKWPHLPALVKKVYKKKRRITCAAFNPSGFDEDFTLGYGNHSAVLPFCDPKKDQIMAEAEKLCKDDQTFFRESCAHAENFLTREALKGLESIGALKENVQQEDIESDKEDDSEEKIKPVKKRRRTESVNRDDCIVTKVEKGDGLSKQGQERIERMSRKTKPLTDFLISETSKEYLQSIYNGSIQSDLHDRFLSGTVRERAKMKHRGFGPIDDDEQIELLLNTYLAWIKQINKKNIHEINYVFDVWVPEAVVFALKKLKGYNRKRAWEQFDKGVRRTKEELRIMHKDLTDVETSRKHISDKPTDFVFK